MSADPPISLTMDRLETKSELIVAQSTSQCCRCACFQPSINWVLNESENFVPGSNPSDLSHSAWIHEESSRFMRTFSGCMPGCRQTKYVQHSGSAPSSIIVEENNGWFTCQKGDITKGLSESERMSNIIAIHEKSQTCGPFCCFPPYLETKNADGKVIGRTEYVCDYFLFVPKFDLIDSEGNQKYRIRPNTCFAGCCVMCHCGGAGGKCCKVPFVIRNPKTFKPVPTEAKDEDEAQVTMLWSGWANECCKKKNAYHVAFPENATAEEKLTLIGSTILLDVVFFEQEDDNN